MKRRALRVFLAFGLAVGSAPAGAQQASSDAEVLKGIRQVDEGDYDAAILTLDAAARRLSRDPARAQEAAQAYLHLGVAYLGKGHEASARAQFREALARVKDLNIAPERFAPKVVEAFERARAESVRGAAPEPSPAAPGRPKAADPKQNAAPAPEKGGGSGKKVLIGALVLAGVGGGVAAAAGGGGGGTPSAGPTPDTRITENFSGSVTIEDFCKAFPFRVGRGGRLEASLSWQEANVALELELFANANQEGSPLARSTRTSQTASQLQFDVSAAGDYSLTVCHFGNSCATAFSGRNALARPARVRRGAALGLPCQGTFTLMVKHP